MDSFTLFCEIEFKNYFGEFYDEKYIFVNYSVTIYEIVAVIEAKG